MTHLFEPLDPCNPGADRRLSRTLPEDYFLARQATPHLTALVRNAEKRAQLCEAIAEPLAELLEAVEAETRRTYGGSVADHYVAQLQPLKDALVALRTGAVWGAQDLGHRQRIADECARLSAQAAAARKDLALIAEMRTMLEIVYERQCGDGGGVGWTKAELQALIAKAKGRTA